MFRASSTFDKLLDKATSNLRLDPDWPSILQICDLIRQNDCSAKYAVTAIKKKLDSTNPHQAMFALLVLESIVKNCGSGVHDEISTKTNCEMLRDLVKTTPHENVRTKVLELIQAWAFAFRNNSKYRAVQDTVNIMNAEGYKFPALKESDAMFSADTAPQWSNGEVCHRCRVAFSLIVRKHHCRACGQVFCQQCSSKTSTIPKFGIEKEVRVCDACYDKVSRPPTARPETSTEEQPAAQQKPPGKTAEELQEEEELQLALALSQSEAEQKEKERRSYSAPPPPSTAVVNPPIEKRPTSPVDSTGNSELSRYLDRAYWEQRNPTAPTSTSSETNLPQKSATPVAQQASQQAPVPPVAVTNAVSATMNSIGNALENGTATDSELEDFVSTLRSQIDIFVNRMKSNSSRGRSIANDTSVQTLFMNITAMHSKLLRYIQKQDDERVYYESLQDKVTAAKDSRAALDTLREEHAERRAREAEAAERQRQLQMAAKLDAMRRKKHEYLEYQRQLALRRVRDTEMELQQRQEQQKQQYMSQHYNYPPYPGQFRPPPYSQSGPQSLPMLNMMIPPQMMPRMMSNGQPMPNQGPVTSQMMNQPQSMPQNNYTAVQGPNHMMPPAMGPQSLPPATQNAPQSPQMNAGVMPNLNQVPQMMQQHGLPQGALGMTTQSIHPSQSMTQPPNMQAHPQSMQQPLHNMQHHPQNIQPPPQNIQQPPQNMRQPPQNLQQQPQNLQQPPQNMQQPPQNLHQPQQNIQQPPQTLHQPPQNMQQPPQTQQNIHQPPQNIQQPPQTLHQPPQHLNQPPQNLQQPPQGIPAGSQSLPPGSQPQMPQDLPQNVSSPQQKPTLPHVTQSMPALKQQEVEVKVECSAPTAELISFD